MTLEADRLVAGYGKTIIVREISLRVEPGEIVFVIGPNGSGKSTTLKALAGMIKPISGTVVLDGTPLPPGEVGSALREPLGTVPQTQNVFPSLTVQENLKVMAPNGWRAGRIHARIRMLCDQIDIRPELLDRRCALLSGGERQRIALAMALMREPSYLLLDEPSAGLSPGARKRIFREIRQIADSGIGILLVEQNAFEAVSISDRGYVLENGAVALEQEAKSLLRDPRMSTLYLGAALSDDA